jgi:hypothetical protein
VGQSFCHHNIELNQKLSTTENIKKNNKSQPIKATQIIGYETSLFCIGCLPCIHGLLASWQKKFYIYKLCLWGYSMLIEYNTVN